jgi:hypothetical protein
MLTNKKTHSVFVIRLVMTLIILYVKR